LEQTTRTVTTELSNLPGEGSDAQVWIYHVFLMKLWYVYGKIDHIVYLRNEHLINAFFVKISHELEYRNTFYYSAFMRNLS